MFNNAGKKIKILAVIMFWLTFIGGSISGIAMTEDTDGLSLLLLPVSFIGGWLANLALYAFGELCENVYEINNMMKMNKASGVSSASVPVNNEPAPVVSVPVNNGNDTVKCPNCGKPTSADSKYCLHCGAMIR